MVYLLHHDSDLRTRAAREFLQPPHLRLSYSQIPKGGSTIFRIGSMFLLGEAQELIVKRGKDVITWKMKKFTPKTFIWVT